MRKHVRSRQMPPSLQKETAALRKSSRNLTSVSGGHLMAALGCFSFGSKLEEREAQKSGAWPSWAGGTESWVRRSDWGSNEKGEKALKGDCAAESFTFGKTSRTQQMRGKKHLREPALEAMSQDKRARVDDADVVQEHSLQLMSRVAEPGTSAPITIWARLQALKRTFALEAEARFLHEAFRTRQLLHCVEVGHKKEFG